MLMQDWIGGPCRKSISRCACIFLCTKDNNWNFFLGKFNQYTQASGDARRYIRKNFNKSQWESCGGAFIEKKILIVISLCIFNCDILIKTYFLIII